MISQLSEENHHRTRLASLTLTQIECIVDLVDRFGFSQREFVVHDRIQFQHERSKEEEHSDRLEESER